MSWAMVGAAAIGAGAGIYGANQAGKAADASVKGTEKAIDEQRRQYNTNLALLEPQRYLGYQAMGDLANLYGYGMSGYMPWNAYNASGGATGVVNVKAKQPGGGGGGSGGLLGSMAGGGLGAALGSVGSFAGPIGAVAGGLIGSALGGSKNTGPNKYYGGQINPLTGTVDAGDKDANVDQYLTEYLRTGVWDPDKKWEGHHEQKYANLRAAIDQIRNQGWTWNAETGQGMFPGQVAPTQPGQPGNMSRFFTSPDYTFRRDEGERGIGGSFAGRGMAKSGGALKALSEFNSNLAAGEYGNYVTRLMNMAGMNTGATTQAIGAGTNMANNVSGLQQNIGDTRASGIYGQANSVVNGLNTGLNTWMMGRYLNQQPTGQPTGSPYGFQYPFDSNPANYSLLGGRRG